MNSSQTKQNRQRGIPGYTRLYGMPSRSHCVQHTVPGTVVLEIQTSWEYIIQQCTSGSPSHTKARPSARSFPIDDVFFCDEGITRRGRKPKRNVIHYVLDTTTDRPITHHRGKESTQVDRRLTTSTMNRNTPTSGGTPLAYVWHISPLRLLLRRYMICSKCPLNNRTWPRR